MGKGHILGVRSKGDVLGHLLMSVSHSGTCCNAQDKINMQENMLKICLSLLRGCSRNQPQRLEEGLCLQVPYPQRKAQLAPQPLEQRILRKKQYIYVTRVV